MNKKVLTAAIVAALGWQGTAMADSSIEQRIQQLEQRAASQADDNDKIKFSGAIEIELGSSDGDSDLKVATVEVGIAAAINDNVSAEIVLLHEEDDTAFSVDTATVNIAASDQLSLLAGQTTVPFGSFESNLVSGPITKDLAETGATALQLDYAVDALTTSIYTFNGTQTGNKFDNYGINLAYSADSFSFGLGYISNIGDSNTINASTIDSAVPGMGINASYSAGDLTVIAEYITASKDFKAGDDSFTSAAKPSATQLEVAYALGDITFAVGMQSSKGAADLTLPESRTAVAVSTELMENTGLALEYASDKDYAGATTNTVTAQLAVSF